MICFLDNVENYDFIHPLVHQSIGIIEDYLKIIFPEGELIYLSVILLSFINEELEKQKGEKFGRWWFVNMEYPFQNYY